MSERRCDRCEWFRAVEDDIGGACREGPPVPIPDWNLQSHRWVSPYVDADHWCGRFRLAERLCAHPMENIKRPVVPVEFDPETDRVRPLFGDDFDDEPTIK